MLDKVLAGTNLGYEFMDEFVILKVVTKDEKKKTIRVSGKVVDEKNMALPGVTVMVKDLKLGTTTGSDGRYVLTIPEIDNIFLVFCEMVLSLRNKVPSMSIAISFIVINTLPA